MKDVKRLTFNWMIFYFYVLFSGIVLSCILIFLEEKSILSFQEVNYLIFFPYAASLILLTIIGKIISIKKRKKERERKEKEIIEYEGTEFSVLKEKEMV